MRALTLNDQAPADTTLLHVLDLAATRPSVAAFLHRAIDRPGIEVVLAADPPDELARELSAAGVDWTKFVFHALPRLVAVARLLQRSPACRCCHVP